MSGCPERPPDGVFGPTEPIWPGWRGTGARARSCEDLPSEVRPCEVGVGKVRSGDVSVEEVDPGEIGIIDGRIPGSQAGPAVGLREAIR